jgi:DNA primase
MQNTTKSEEPNITTGNIHNTTDTNKEEEGKEEDKYIGGRPSLFEEARWQRQQEEDARIAREAQDMAFKRTTTISKAIQRFESKPMHKHCIPSKDMITMEQARLLYNEMFDDCLRETLPLTDINDLTTTESCIPDQHDESDAIITTISHAIMRRLKCIIPETNRVMLEILGPFNNDRDGYGTMLKKC